MTYPKGIIPDDEAWVYIIRAVTRQQRKYNRIVPWLVMVTFVVLAILKVVR